MILDNKSDWDAGCNNLILKQDDDEILGTIILDFN